MTTRSPLAQFNLPRRPMYDLVYEVAGFRIEVGYDSGACTIFGATDEAHRKLASVPAAEVLMGVLQELDAERHALETQLAVVEAAQGLCQQLFADTVGQVEDADADA